MTAPPTRRRRLDAACDVAISADSRLLATTSSRSIRILDLATGRKLASANLSNPASIDFSPQSDRLVVTTSSGEQRLYTAPDLDELARFSGDRVGMGAGARFDATGRRTIQATWSGAIIVREDDREVHRADARGRMFRALIRHPADRRLLLTETNGPAMPREAALLAVDEHGTESIVFRPDMPLLNPAVSSTGLIASGSGDALVVRDLEGRELARLDHGPDRQVKVAAWSPDGQELLTIEDDIPPREVLLARVRDHLRGTAAPDDPETIQAYTPDLEPTWSLPLVYASDAAYSPDGTTLVLGSWERGEILDRG